MRRTLLLASVTVLLTAATAQAQIGSPGIEYTGTIAGGDGVQMYPYDQQDPWLHGHFHRHPAYGGFSSFRPYNYRHVFSQTQIATRWGSAHGMPYSQQFWNKYRGNYMNGNLHSQMSIPYGYPGVHPQPQPFPVMPGQPAAAPVYPASSVRPIGYEQQLVAPPMTAVSRDGRPIHVFPGQ